MLYKSRRILAYILVLLIFFTIPTFADSYTDKIDKYKQDWYAANEASKAATTPAAKAQAEAAKTAEHGAAEAEREERNKQKTGVSRFLFMMHKTCIHLYLIYPESFD